MRTAKEVYYVKSAVCLCVLKWAGVKRVGGTRWTEVWPTDRGSKRSGPIRRAACSCWFHAQIASAEGLILSGSYNRGGHGDGNPQAYRLAAPKFFFCIIFWENWALRNVYTFPTGCWEDCWLITHLTWTLRPLRNPKGPHILSSRITDPFTC